MDNKFGFRDKVGYMLGDLANDFFFIFASSFLMVFYTKVLGIDTAIVGTLFLTARLVDAFTDITMGRIVDTMRPRKDGRFRPWIKWMSVPVAFAGLLLFVPWVAKLPMTARIVYIFVTYILWGSFCYTAVNIPYGSMASVITSDPIERGSLSTARSIGPAIAGILINVGVPLIVYMYDDNGNQVVLSNRFFAIACVFAVAAVICYLLCYRMTTERVELVKREKKHNGVWKTLSNMAQNRSLISIIVSAVVLLLSMLLTQSMNIYLFMDYFKSKEAMSVAGFLSTAATLVLAPFATKIIERFGKKEASTVAVLFASAIYFILYFMRVKNPWVFCVLIGLGNIGTGLFNLMVWAFITDIIDHQEVKTGERDDGTIYAAYSFARKLGQALAGGVGGWALALIGYVSSVAGETVVQTQEVVEKIYTVTTLVPAVCYLIVGLILALWYPLTRSRVLENSRVLKERRRESGKA